MAPKQPKNLQKIFHNLRFSIKKMKDMKMSKIIVSLNKDEFEMVRKFLGKKPEEEGFFFDAAWVKLNK